MTISSLIYSGMGCNIQQKFIIIIIITSPSVPYKHTNASTTDAFTRLQNNIHVSKVHCDSAFGPGASGLSYYCAPLGARGKWRGRSPGAAARHLQPARVHSDFLGFFFHPFAFFFKTRREMSGFQKKNMRTCPRGKVFAIGSENGLDMHN